MINLTGMGGLDADWPSCAGATRMHNAALDNLNVIMMVAHAGARRNSL